MINEQLAMIKGKEEGNYADMMEIYKKFAVNYDELVAAEDYQNHVADFLHRKIQWENAVVYEAGIGTGRITKIYIDDIRRCYGFDRESHMLTSCQKHLRTYQDKLVLEHGDNANLPLVPEPVDIFIEGWSFGHTMLEHEAQYRTVFKEIYLRLCNLVRQHGTMIVIETLGTNVHEPTSPPGLLTEFYGHLENDYHFARHVLATDYRFSNHTEAARIMGFFFGEEMFDQIINARQDIIPEFTGIWIKENDDNEN